MQYCVTVNGNIVEFNSPEGVEQIDQGSEPYEGYGICDDTTGIAYYDYAYTDSGNWNAPTTVTSNSTEVKIERSTSDGAWTLTQTISKETGPQPYAKIAMQLKNNSGVTKVANLLRFVNQVPDNAGATDDIDEYYDGTGDSAWGYTPIGAASGADPYGLMVTVVGNPTPTSVAYGRVGFAQNTFRGPNPCDWTANLASPVLDAAGSTVYFYDFNLKKNQSVTSTLKYTAF